MEFHFLRGSDKAKNYARHMKDRVGERKNERRRKESKKEEEQPVEKMDEFHYLDRKLSTGSRRKETLCLIGCCSRRNRGRKNRKGERKRKERRKKEETTEDRKGGVQKTRSKKHDTFLVL